MLRRGSDGENLSGGSRYRGSAVDVYMTVSEPGSDGIEGTNGIVQFQELV